MPAIGNPGPADGERGPSGQFGLRDWRASALQHAGMDSGIVWFDAHGDVQTLETHRFWLSGRAAVAAAGSA